MVQIIDNLGEIVPCEITVSLLENKMRSHGWDNTFIIDGFPRNNGNIAGWNDKMLDKTDVIGIITLIVDANVIFERIKIRHASLGKFILRTNSTKHFIHLVSHIYYFIILQYAILNIKLF